MSLFVDLDPVAHQTDGVLQRFEALAVNAPLVQRLDDTLDDAVLLGVCGVMSPP